MKLSHSKKEELERIAEIAGSFFDSKIKKIRRFESGIINTSYAVTYASGKQTVLRIYNPQKQIQDVIFEIDVMMKLRLAKIPTPEIFYSKTKKPYAMFKDANGKNRIAVMMEFIKGKELAPADYAYADACASVQAKMHRLLSVRPNPRLKEKNLLFIKSWMDKEVRIALRNKKLSIRIRNKIIEIHKRISNEWKLKKEDLGSVPFGIVHFDYDSTNILVADKKIKGVIDFDDVIITPVVVDLSFSLWWWLSFSFKNKKTAVLTKYLASYARVRPLSKKERDVLWYCISVRNLILLSLLYVNHSAHPKIKEIKKAFDLDSFIQTASRK